MDISEKYIKMCEKAEEIQNFRDIFQLGDFLWKGKKYLYEGCVCDKLSCFKDEEIWLPRQDQLQELAEIKSIPTLQSKFNDFMYDDIIYTGQFIKSYERLWLAFVMKEKYNKFWDGDEWMKNESSKRS